ESQQKSIESMYEDGISSQKNLLEAQSETSVKQAELERVNSILSMFSASTEKGVFQIKAPESGIVTRKNITEGMQISAGSDALFTISDLDEVWILINVYSGSISQIKKDMQVQIRSLSYPEDRKSVV